MKIWRSSLTLLLVLAGVFGAHAQTVQTASANVQVKIGSNGGTCTQKANGTSTSWTVISESANDTIMLAPDSPYSSVTVTFVTGTAAFPGTPFWDDASGQWSRTFNSGTTSPPATLTIQEQSSFRFVRFPYASVTFNDGTHCSFPPNGGMGVQVTR